MPRESIFRVGNRSAGALQLGNLERAYFENETLRGSSFRVWSNRSIVLQKRDVGQMPRANTEGFDGNDASATNDGRETSGKELIPGSGSKIAAVKDRCAEEEWVGKRNSERATLLTDADALVTSPMGGRRYFLLTDPEEYEGIVVDIGPADTAPSAS